MSETKKKYPPKNASTCVVCEDIRTEATGKLILLGVYPGETVNFFKKPTEDNPGLVNLALSLWFRKCSGKFQTRFSVVGPDDTEIVNQTLGEQSVEAGRVMTFAIKIQNAAFTAPGDYAVVVYLDEKEYEFPLYVTYTNED